MINRNNFSNSIFFLILLIMIIIIKLKLNKFNSKYGTDNVP